jgi:hypothetical protein
MKYIRISSVSFILLLVSSVIFSVDVTACKDVIACGDSTGGDYNLLLKVRDPSRPGLQVLCIVPKGYEYTYFHPWTGKPMDFQTKHKYIGVTSLNDTIPNIVKAGMSLSDSGVSYGDADTNSYWKNPTRYAWDDFDWVRYACEKADDEDEAVYLLTNDCVDELHASGVSENLFVVGSNKGFVVEADAFRYDIKEITNGIITMSNYPKELWKTQLRRKLLVASSFDIVKEKFVKKGDVLKLDSLYGVRAAEIGENWITVHPVPIFKIVNKKIIFQGNPINISLGERETVGDFSVELMDINGSEAEISVCFVYKAWEDKMMQLVQSCYGSITVRDMINWSRLHEEDLDGLRPMCEDIREYEAAAIYKIPKENYEVLSSFWFAANHGCSSIFVPVHICVEDIFAPFQHGSAAALSLKLLNAYGHNKLNSSFCKVENVFLNEIKLREEIAVEMIENNSDISDFLTTVDVNMQKQAWLTEHIWLDISNISDDILKKQIIEIVDGMWNVNYSVSISLMEYGIIELESLSGTENIVDKIEEIILSINEIIIE